MTTFKQKEKTVHFKHLALYETFNNIIIIIIL